MVQLVDGNFFNYRLRRRGTFSTFTFKSFPQLKVLILHLDLLLSWIGFLKIKVNKGG